MSASATDTRVRVAGREDLPAIVAAVQELLTELGSQPPCTSQMLQTIEELFADPRLGALLVAEAEPSAEVELGAEVEPGAEGVAEKGAALVGVLTASYQLALHVPGRYALIQDLWVRPAWRGRAVGHELLGALFELARSQGMLRAEVGLPRESFAGIRATEAFYAHNGFEHLGARMRRIFR